MSEICNDFQPLLIQINKLLKEGTVILAIDGGSGSGKTTLSRFLESQYACTVFHVDDFFLREEQRTPERYAEIGGNFDRERFLDEVLLPLQESQTIQYRKFDCSTLQLSSPIRVNVEKLVVIEGVYAMHPELADYYTFSVFLDITKDAQKQRILLREPKEKAQRYFEKWIPMEDEYFEEMQVKERCDMCVSIDLTALID
jgi:uridine kinase